MFDFVDHYNECVNYNHSEQPPTLGITVDQIQEMVNKIGGYTQASKFIIYTPKAYYNEIYDLVDSSFDLFNFRVIKSEYQDETKIYLIPYKDACDYGV